MSHDETASGYSTVYNVRLANEKYGIKRPIRKWSNIFRTHPCSVINICLFVFFFFFNDRDSEKICDKSRFTGEIVAIMKVSATIENTVKRQLLGP